MTVKLGVVMDPIADITYKKDTTLALLWAAQDRDWELYYMEQGDLYLDQGEARAAVAHLTVFRDPDNWFSMGKAHDMALADLDVILMRKDPPFDNEYIYSTYILEAAERKGTLIVNRCQSLRGFHEEHGDTIFKPLDGMGGSAIFRVQPGDPNVSVILETLTHHGTQTIMAQTFLPEIVDGDKRILMINGEAVPYCLARVPLAGETRGNLAAGGQGRAQPLTERDAWIAAQVGPTLKEKGLLFVGLDVIGDYLTEINVTSPTCVREIDAGFDLDIGADLMDCIEGEMQSRS